jgi:hypothetical protein
VQPPEINVGRNGALLQNLQKNLALGFNDDAMPNQVKRLVPSGSPPAFLVRSMFAGGQGVQSLLPGALRNPGIGAGEVGFGNLQVKDRLPLGLIFGFDDLPGLVFAGGAQTGAFPGLGVHTVEGATPNAPANQAVTRFHSFTQPRR